MCLLINTKAVIAERKSKNWTQQRLAEMCGLSLRTIQRIEKKGVLSNESLICLCSVFEISGEQLLVPEHEPSKRANRFLSEMGAAVFLKRLYSHGIILFAACLFAMAWAGLLNSEIDSRDWLLIASMSSASALLSISLTRNKDL